MLLHANCMLYYCKTQTGAKQTLKVLHMSLADRSGSNSRVQVCLPDKLACKLGHRLPLSALSTVNYSQGTESWGGGVWEEVKERELCAMKGI